MRELFLEIKSLIKHRELLQQIALREVKARYKQSVLGYFWVIINPFAQMIVMSFAFSIIIRIPMSDDKIPYSLFLFVGLLPWNLFVNSITWSTQALISSASLIKQVMFPRSILILSTIYAKIIDFLFALIILAVYMIWYKIGIDFNILWVIPIFFLQQIFTIAICLILAAANLFYRDIQYVINLLVMLWMYLTPIIYPANIIPQRFQFVLKLNPIATFVDSYRDTILYQKTPNIPNLLIAALISFIFLIFSLKYFKSKEKYFADSI